MAPPAPSTAAELFRLLSNIGNFSDSVLRRPLRPYQLAPAQAIARSVLNQRGLTFAVMMSRQAGKNETSAQLEAYLLTLFSRKGGNIVKCAPTFRPQTLNSMLRLRQVFQNAIIDPPKREHGFMLRQGNATATFMSASERAETVGQTASILLEADEAQDIDEAIWSKNFRPMAASTNATTVMWGTSWTSQTLLARTIATLRQLEKRDQIQRVFTARWDEVAQVLPTYGRYVQSEIDRLGPTHPIIRTQYFLEEIDSQAGMFTNATQTLMHGQHLRQTTPIPGRAYAFLIDVAGEAEEPIVELSMFESRRQDSTAITIIEMVREPVALPSFLIINRLLFTGTPHHQLEGAIVTLAHQWAPTHIVIDSTGVGAGLTSYLTRALGPRVIPFLFTSSSKSELGWAFLGICNSGRFLDHRDDGSDEYTLFWHQVQAARYEILPGPQKTLRFGVPSPTLHDDLLLSAALCATLESAPTPPTEAQIIEAEDFL